MKLVARIFGRPETASPSSSIDDALRDAAILFADENYDADGVPPSDIDVEHHMGQGVPRDPITAYAWLMRARWGGSKLAERFNSPVFASLSPEEVELGKEMARSLPQAEAQP